MGKSGGVPLVAWVGDALESKVLAHRHEEGGVVWRWDVLRGMKAAASSFPQV